MNQFELPTGFEAFLIQKAMGHDQNQDLFVLREGGLLTPSSPEDQATRHHEIVLAPTRRSKSAAAVDPQWPAGSEADG